MCPPNNWATPMHLSLLTTFAPPPIFLVCPPNIFDKSTSVDEVTVSEAKPSRNFTRKSRTERLLSLSHEFLKTRAEKTKFPRRVGVLPRTIGLIPGTVGNDIEEHVADAQS